MKLWNVNTRTNIATFRHGGQGSITNSVAFSPDGRTLASGGGVHYFNQTIRLWDIASQTNIATLTGHSNSIRSLAFSPDGTILATGAADNTVKLWNVSSRASITTLEGHTSSVSSVAFSPDGTTLASGAFDKTVKLWDIATQTNIATLVDDVGSTSVVFSPDGATLASGTRHKTVRLWNLATGEKIATLGSPITSIVSWTPVAFSPDGTTLATVAQTGYENSISRHSQHVTLWDVATQAKIARWQGHANDVEFLAFSPNGNMLASASGDATIRLWNTSEWAEAPVTNHPPRGVVRIRGTTAVGETLTADVSTVMDPDGPSTLVFSYQWLADGSPIVGATSETYTLTANEIGKKIRVRVSYIDGLGAPVNVTSAETVTNRNPTFTDGTSTTRTVTENTAANTNIGTAIAATDADTGDTLTYTLGGTDAASFSINSSTGQLQTKAALDYETKISYAVTITVSDGNGGSDSITVTISVTDVDDYPLYGRTQQVQNAIVAAVPGVNSAADMTEAHLAAITELSLSDKTITSLKLGDFDDLSSMTTLSIIDTQLSTIPTGIFDGLTNLAELKLYQNDFTTLPADIFNELTSLTTLQMFKNRLPTLPVDIFDGLTSLTTLHLGTLNNLVFRETTTLPVDIFDGLTSLTTLNLQGNNFTTLPADIFDGLTSLTELWLNACELTTLPEGIFDGLTNLETLILSVNNFTTLPGKIFDELTSLTFLDLQNGELSSLPADTFDGLISLKTLFLQNNRLTSLPDGIFGGLTSLSFVSLRGNTGAPFRIGLSLKKVGTDQFKAVVPTGAPYNIIFPITVANGSIKSLKTTITIPAGSVESQPLTVTGTAGTTAPVTVNIGTLPNPGFSGSGYTLAKSVDLPITVIEGGIPEIAVLTLTVGAGPGAALKGYNPHSHPDWNFGNLSSTTFVLNGVSYTVHRLYYNVAGKRLEFQTSPMLRGFELHLDSHLLRSFSALDFNLHQWNNVNLRWSVNQRVRVQVVETIPRPPDAPTNLTATPSYEKVTLSWKPPTNADPITLPVTEYELRVSDDGGNTWDPDWHIISRSRSGQSNRTSCTIGDEDHNPNIDDIIDINLTNGTSYTFEIRARGGDGSGDAARITVTPANENTAPVFTDGNTTTRAIAENAAANTNIGTAIAATDTDTGDTLTYTLSGTDAAVFSIVSTTGQLRTKTSLDYETKRVYTVTITVSDGSLTDVITVTINVTDVNDTVIDRPFVPVANRTPQVRDAIVRAAGVQSAADVTEADLAEIWQLDLERKSITSLKVGDFDGLTSLRTLSIRDNQLTTLPADIFDGLTVLTTLNLEGNQLSTLPVDILADLTELLYLTLADNHLTTLPAGIFEGPSALRDLWLDGNRFTTLPVGLFKSKNLASGFNSLRRLYLEGNTVDPLPLTLSLEKVTDGQFKAVAPTGATFKMVLPISVMNGSINGGATTVTIPKGRVESETLTVTRTVGTTAAVTVNIGTMPSLPQSHEGYALRKSTDLPLEVISDINTAPMFTDGINTTRMVAENTAANTNIGTAIAATDADTGDTLTYTLSGTDASSFSIVSTSGQLQTKAALDYETKTTYSVTVSVSDGNDGSDAIDVTINVTDVNEVPTNTAPVFTDGTSTTRTIAENTVSGTNIGTAIAATDADNDVLTYTLGGTNAASFSIVSTSGQLQTSAALDYETKSSYSVTVSVSDGNDGSDSITVTINVTNVDENTIDPPLSERTPQVRDAIVAAVPGVNNAADVTEAHLAAIPLLWLESKGIRSLKSGDFDGFASLGVLSLSDNSISDISALEGLNALRVLELSDNSISDISVLEGLNALTALELSNNSIKDTSALENLNALEYLGLSDNSISDISALEDLNSLTTLSLSDNSISDISALENLTALTTLGLSNNSISDISALENLTALTGLTLRNNSISDISALEDLNALIALGLANNSISDISALEDLNALTLLDLSNNSINDISALEDLNSLTTLYLSRNPISDYGPLHKLKAAIEAIEDHPGLTLDITIPDETTNNAPVFTDGSRTTRSVAENTAANTNIGTAITATDADNDTLTYSLSGTDASSFAIDRNTGQLRTKAALDYETKTSYSVTVSVSDGSLTDTITVTINITDINELPTTTAICKVGDVLAPGESCTYPGTDAVFSVRDDGSSQWNIPNFPWLNKVSAGGSISFTADINDENYHFVAKEVANNSWEIEEIGDDTNQQPPQPEIPQPPGNTGGNPTLSVSTTAPLTEATLHGGIITLNLSSGIFESSIFWIRNAISVSGINGVTVESFGGERISDTQATIELEYEGNMTVNGTLTISLEADGIKDYDGATLTAQIPVTANTESVTASTAAPLTEVTLDESIVTLTLSGAKYESSIWDLRGNVTVSGIAGVTIPWNQPQRKSDTELTVELEFDGDMTADGTLTFTVGADAIAGYNGPALTAQIAVAADRENALLANFPNPFNPETWIPYQLAKPTEVTITIYNINGHVVRTLALGHQAAGIYQSRSRAAYWDGRNTSGEPVASGVYFYTLTAGDFTATRKMLIRK